MQETRCSHLPLTQAFFHIFSTNPAENASKQPLRRADWGDGALTSESKPNQAHFPGAGHHAEAAG